MSIVFFYCLIVSWFVGSGLGVFAKCGLGVFAKCGLEVFAKCSAL